RAAGQGADAALGVAEPERGIRGIRRISSAFTPAGGGGRDPARRGGGRRACRRPRDALTPDGARLLDAALAPRDGQRRSSDVAYARWGSHPPRLRRYIAQVDHLMSCSPDQAPNKGDTGRPAGTSNLQ